MDEIPVRCPKGHHGEKSFHELKDTVQAEELKLVRNGRRSDPLPITEDECETCDLESQISDRRQHVRSDRAGAGIQEG